MTAFSFVSAGVAALRAGAASGVRACLAAGLLAALPVAAQPFAGAPDRGALPDSVARPAPGPGVQARVGVDLSRMRGVPPAAQPGAPGLASAVQLREPDAEADAPALFQARPAAPADTTDEVRERPLPLTVFGYYRLLLYGRNITDPYPNLAPFERTYGVGDGYREPMLSVNVLGRPNGRSSFGTELFVFSPYDGTEEAEEVNTISLNLGVNLYGSFRTEAGVYGVRAGGIHWYNLSPFTIGVYQPLDRYSVFERTPWEGVSGTAKYQNYFETGKANPGDERFDFQAFQGLIVNGAQLPGDVGFDLFWGKTQPNGGLPNAETVPGETVPGEGDVPTYTGFEGDARELPSFIAGGRVQRAFGDSRLAFNTITSYRTLDSLTTDRRQYQVHTGSFDANVAGLNVSGELGASLFESPTYDTKWGEALMVRARVPAERTALPLDLQVYQIGRNFFNENSEILTGNNPQLRLDPRCEVVPGSGAQGATITQVNQLEHNRRGVNFNTAWNSGPARLAVGWGMAHELAPTTSTLVYVHRINGLALSRVYNPFPADAVCATNFGPLQRKYSIFRNTIERAQTTDVDPVTGIPTTRKYYHAVDLQGKARATVLDRPLYFFYLGSFGSANRTATVLPRDDDTYLFAQYHEFDLYYELAPGFVAAGYLGLENVQGGRFTELDETSGRPRDQAGRGIGLGFDWTVARNAGLYLRHRWMDFEDRSFALDTYSGHETTLEFKLFF